MSAIFAAWRTQLLAPGHLNANSMASSCSAARGKTNDGVTLLLLNEHRAESVDKMS
jgi:hypothetical protein